MPKIQLDLINFRCGLETMETEDNSDERYLVESFLRMYKLDVIKIFQNLQ